MKLNTWKWHSINIIPHITFYTLVNIRGKVKDYGRAMQLTIFGRIFNLSWKAAKAKRAWSSYDHVSIGLCYSREKKKWYWY